MINRMRVGICASVAVLAACAAFAGAAHATLTNCGTVRARGFTFHVAQVKLPSCAAARALTLTLAHMGLPKLGVRPYAGVHLSMRCFGAVRGRAAQIQCTSSDGKRTLYAVAKP